MLRKLQILLLICLLSQTTFSQNKDSINVEDKTTVKQVLDNYIIAIGGSIDKVKNIKSRALYQSTYTIVKTSKTSDEIEGKMLSVIGNKQETVVVVGGAKDKIASKVVFDGSKGYTDIPGVIKNNFDNKMVSFYKEAIHLFHQLTNRANYSKKVEVKDFDGKVCYMLEMNAPIYGGKSFKTYEYYSKESGLLIGASFENEQTKSISYFKDYTLFDGILTSTLQVASSKMTTLGSTVLTSVYTEKAAYNVETNKFINGSNSFLKEEISFYPSLNKHKNAVKDLKNTATNTVENSSNTSITDKDVTDSNIDPSEENIRSRIFKELSKGKKSSKSVSEISSTISPQGKKFDVQDLVDQTGSTTLKYRRSSLYTIMINDETRERNSVIKNAFGNSEMSEKFNDHNIGPYLMDGTGGEKDQTGSIQSYLDQNNVAKELVARWFNRDENGNFDMNLIAERGQYNASDLNARIANGSKRGKALLKDAGEELIGNTFVIVYDFNYTNKEDQAKKRGGLFKIISSVASLAGADDIALLADGANLASDVVGKGYFVKTTSYLYRLVWDDNIANKFYEEYWNDAENHSDSRVAAFDKAQFFKLKYVGSEVSRSNLQSTVFTAKSNDELIEVSTTKAFDKNIGKLQRTYEEFRVKTPLYKGDPISAKIGLKEDLENGDKFEVLEQVIDDQGNTSYRRIGKIKVEKGMIWDNTFLSEEVEEETAESSVVEESKKGGFFARFKKNKEDKVKPPYTVFSGKAGVYASGMLIRQIN